MIGPGHGWAFFPGCLELIDRKKLVQKISTHSLLLGAGLSHNKLAIIVKGARKKLQIVESGNKHQSNQFLGLQMK